MIQLKYDKYTGTRIVGYVFTLKDEFYEIWETDSDIAFAFQFPEEFVYPHLDKSPSHITLKDWESNSKIICDSAFMNCKELLSIEIPEGVTTIESKAFQGCENLYAVYLPSSVTEIQDSAFNCCRNLKDVIFKNGIQNKCRIAPSAFNNCKKLSTINLSQSTIALKYKTQNILLDNNGIIE